MNKKKVIVIGGNGFIGRNLVNELVNQSFEVIVYDIYIPSAPNEKISNVTYIEGNVSNIDYLYKTSENANAVIWLFHSNVPATSLNEIETDYHINTIPLIQFCRRITKNSKIDRFVYLSSGGTIYGDSTNFIPIKEDYQKKPISSYGLSKLVCEQSLSYIFSNSKINLYILRPSNVYGRYQNLKKPQGIIGLTFLALMSNQPIIIFGSGLIIRDYIHVFDLSQSVIKCLNHENIDSSEFILNIGSGQGVSINEITSQMSLIANKPYIIDRRPDRSFDCKYNVLDISKAKEVLKWGPTISINTGLTDVWDWIKSQ